MDPNACLTELLALSRQIQDVADSGEPMDGACAIQDLSRVTELVQALDGWIGQGGFLPVRWALAQLDADR